MNPRALPCLSAPTPSRLVEFFRALCSAPCSSAPYATFVALFLALQTGTVRVTNNHDSGPGSFRWAVEQANQDSTVRTITFSAGLEPIAIRSTLTFTGAQKLSISGKGAVIDGGAARGTAFLANGGGDIALEGLTFRNADGEGVAVQVPADARGTIRVTLRNVTITGNKGHGLLVNDQVNPDVAAGSEPDSSGSAAGLHVEITNSQFLRNGHSVSDRDGIRINDGAGGGLTFIARGVRTEDNAADGIELDERGTGDVRVDVADLTVTGNGSFDPGDIDDGFDIDEMDDGSIFATLTRIISSDNREDGLDFTETGRGDLVAELHGSSTTRNGGVGIRAEQQLPGAGTLLLQGVELEGNGMGKTAGRNVTVRQAGEDG